MSTTTINNNTKLNNKEICNAFGCFENALEKVDIDVGTFGTISLNFCSQCAKKFQVNVIKKKCRK